MIKLFWPSWQEVAVTLRPGGSRPGAAGERGEDDPEQGTTPG